MGPFCAWNSQDPGDSGDDDDGDGSDVDDDADEDGAATAPTRRLPDAPAQFVRKLSREPYVQALLGGTFLVAIWVAPLILRTFLIPQPP